MVAPHESKTTHTRACTRATCAGAQPSVSSLASPPRSSAQRSRRVPPFFSFFSSDFHTRRIVEQDRTGPGRSARRAVAGSTNANCVSTKLLFLFCFLCVGVGAGAAGGREREGSLLLGRFRVCFLYTVFYG
jgi:hypothetical protein